MTTGEVFLFAFNGIMPIVLLIILGYFLKKINLLNDNFLSVGNKLVFKAALPTLLFYNVYNIDSIKDIDPGTVFFSLFIILILFLLGLVMSFFVKDNRQKGVIWQSFFRSNFAIIGLPLSEAIGGTSGLQIASVLSAFSIPAFNIMAVIALTVFTRTDGDKKIGFKAMLKKIITNPLIIGVAVGFLFLALRQILPLDSNGNPVFTIKDNVPFLYSAIGSMSRIASPLALIILGGQFRFDSVKILWKQITLGTVARNIFAPAVGLLAAAILSENTDFFNFTLGHYASFVALFGSPIAVSSAIMATQMNNDEQLANQILVWTSIFSIFTIFITIVVLKSVKLL